MVNSYGKPQHPSGPGTACCLCGEVELSRGWRKTSAWTTVSPAWDPSIERTQDSKPTHYFVTSDDGDHLPVAKQLAPKAQQYLEADLKCSSKCRKAFLRKYRKAEEEKAAHALLLQAGPSHTTPRRRSANRLLLSSVAPSSPAQTRQGLQLSSCVPVSLVASRASQRLKDVQVCVHLAVLELRR